MRIFDFIPGFRTRKIWKMVLAILYYVLAILIGIFEDWGTCLVLFFAPFFIFSFIDLILYRKRGGFFPKILATIVVSLVIIGIGFKLVPEPPVESKTGEVTKTSTKVKDKDNVLEFYADMSIKVDNLRNRVIVTIDSNVPDGGIFEISVVDGNLQILSDFVPIEGNKIVKGFDVPDTWDVGYLAGTALFRFNLPDHPQPDHIKNIYGNNGENMIGENAVEAVIDGETYKTGNADPVTIAYPDIEAVKAKQKEATDQVFQKIIDNSDGVVLSIEQMMPEEGWKITKVVVSDAWYNSEDYIKERFASEFSESIKTILIKAEQITADETISVVFYDSFDKEVASPKMFGDGYNIER